MKYRNQCPGSSRPMGFVDMTDEEFNSLPEWERGGYAVFPDDFVEPDYNDPAYIAKWCAEFDNTPESEE